MIPKIIHYTWFSGDPFPSKVKNCIDCWSEKLPGYKFKKWDMDSIKDIDSIFLKEALASKKWAFAADFVRLWAVYNDGGIYMDTDVLLYKSFDGFLDQRAFIGIERYLYYEIGKVHTVLGSHCFGAEKGHPFIKSCLEYYDGRHFITSYNENLPNSLRFNQLIMPYIQAEIACKCGFDFRVHKSEEIQFCKDGLIIYPSEYFDNSNWTKETSLSVCAHLSLGGWQENNRNTNKGISFMEKMFWRFFLPIIKKWLSKFGYAIFRCD